MKRRLCTVLFTLLLCVPVMTSTAGAAALGELPEFYFSSGVGAWGTALNINADGSFEGEYYDTDTDGTDTGPYYATTRICQFSGSFTDIKQIDAYTFSMRVGALKTAHAKGEEWIEDNIRYITSDPYGIPAVGGEVRLYLPGHATSTLPAEFLNWYQSPNGITVLPEKLPCFGLYNMSEQLGFSSSDEESAKALTHWNLPVDGGTSVISLAAREELQDFLVQFWWGWSGQTYDYRDIATGHLETTRGRTILQALIGDAVCYAGPIPNEYASYSETNWMGHDPLGKWNSYHKNSGTAVSWILENVFNCSQPDIAKLQLSLSQSDGG